MRRLRPWLYGLWILAFGLWAVPVHAQRRADELERLARGGCEPPGGSRPALRARAAPGRERARGGGGGAAAHAHRELAATSGRRHGSCSGACSTSWVARRRPCRRSSAPPRSTRNRDLRISSSASRCRRAAAGTRPSLISSSPRPARPSCAARRGCSPASRGSSAATARAATSCSRARSRPIPRASPRAARGSCSRARPRGRAACACTRTPASSTTPTRRSTAATTTPACPRTRATRSFSWGTGISVAALRGESFAVSIGGAYDQNAHLELSDWDSQQFGGSLSAGWQAHERAGPAPRRRPLARAARQRSLPALGRPAAEPGREPRGARRLAARVRRHELVRLRRETVLERARARRIRLRQRARAQRARSGASRTPSSAGSGAGHASTPRPPATPCSASTATSTATATAAERA